MGQVKRGNEESDLFCFKKRGGGKGGPTQGLTLVLLNTERFEPELFRNKLRAPFPPRRGPWEVFI